MTSKHGNEEDNFPFRFATEVSLPREQVDTEESLKLLGFSDEAVHGWEITPLRTPPVVNYVMCQYVCVGRRGEGRVVKY